MRISLSRAIIDNTLDVPTVLALSVFFSFKIPFVLLQCLNQNVLDSFIVVQTVTVSKVDGLNMTSIMICLC